MDAWWGALSNFEKVFWITAVGSTAFFALQMIFTFFVGGDLGVDDAADADMGADADGSFFLGLFTIRNMVAFFLGFSWFGLAAFQFGLGRIGSVAVGTVAGAVLVALVMLLMKTFSSLQSSGTVSLQNAVGKSGDVQIAVPAAMNGRGKVNVVLQGRLMELMAATKGERIEKGAQVEVVDVIGNQALIVKKHTD